MASEKQLAANCRNGKKGGPKTPRGKRASSRNALRHGLRAKSVVMPGENPEDFEALRQSFIEHYQPAGLVEEDLVEQIAVCTWRRKRATLIETGMMHLAKNEAEFTLRIERVSFYGAAEELDESLALLAEIFRESAPSLMLLMRYKAHNDRQLRQARLDLELAQARRKLEAAELAKMIEGITENQNEAVDRGPMVEAVDAVEVVKGTQAT